MGNATMGLGEQLRAARLRRNLTASDVAGATRMKVQIVEALEREDFSKIAAPIYAKGFIKLYAEEVGLPPGPLIDEYIRRFALPQPPPSLAVASAPERAETATDAAPPAPSGSVRSVPADRRPKDSNAKPDTDADPDLFARVDVSARDLTRPETRKPNVAEPSRLATGAALLRKHLSRPITLFRSRAILARIGETGDRLLRNAAPWGRAWFQTFRTLPEKIRVPFHSLRPSDSPRTTASVAVGIIIILIFVISGFSRCVRTSDDTIVSPAEETRELRIAVDPPPPYID